MYTRVKTRSGQSAYQGQMGHFFSGRRVKLIKSGVAILSNIAVTNAAGLEQKPSQFCQVNGLYFGMLHKAQQ